MRLHTSDTVVVITGKDKGKTGKILRVLRAQERVVVEGVNMRTRHVRKTPQKPGQIIRYEASIHMSNVMFLDSKSKKRSRIGYQLQDGKKLRMSKRSRTAITASKTSKVETVSKDKKEVPPKKPFWKKLGFGADALEEAEEHEESKDHSVPSDSRLQSSRSHGRGS